MNKIMKAVISIVMSFAMAVCLAPTGAGVKAMSSQEDGISPQGFGIGTPYSIKDNYTQITAYFTSPNSLLVRCKNLTKKARYTELNVFTPSKSFAKRTFTVGAEAWHSESYSISAYNTSKVTMIVYPHTTTSPSSGYINSLKGVMMD